MIRRDIPELIEVEFENGESPDLKEFYNEEDHVVFREFKEQGFDVAFDFEDSCIMIQNKEHKETHISNLLYAREHLRGLYEIWFQERSKYGRIDR